MRRRRLPARTVRGGWATTSPSTARKAFNGVAMLSKFPFDEVSRGLPGDRRRRPCALSSKRWSRRRAGRCASRSIYLPNGNPPETEKYSYKLAWMKRLSAYARDRLPLEEPLVLAGDYNVIPEPRRCAQSANVGRRCPVPAATRAANSARSSISASPTRCARATDEPGLYTFWDYQAGAWQKNNGIRIDHMLLSPAGRRPADRCRHRPARAHLGEAVRSRAGVA